MRTGHRKMNRINFIIKSLSSPVKMPKILIISLFLLSSIAVYSQTEKRFVYNHLYSANLVTPLFDKSKPEGTEGIAVWTNDKYIHDLFNKTIDKVISNEKRDSLHLGTAIMIAFNLKGEVINCKFMIDSKDTTVISEDDLYNLYTIFKKIKINMYRVKIGLDPSKESKTAEYAVISGSLISKKGRDRMIKELENR
jgi:hypothetical protein